MYVEEVGVVQQQRLWWFGTRGSDEVAEFRRRELIAIVAPPQAQGPQVATDADGPLDHAPDAAMPGTSPLADPHRNAFEHEIAVGDLVLVRSGTAGPILIGEVLGDPLRRPGLHAMQCMRAVIWRCEAPEPGWLAPAPADGGDRGDGQPVLLDRAHRAGVEALIDAHADAFKAEACDIRIDTTPPAVTLPQIPILFQSPHAERILRDFRWREYLLANPDVAATGNDEAHAFRHFFYQGYYERRIFDPKRLDGFDPGYYRERYPELGLANDAEAQIHYCYQGWYELRIPNRDSAWLYDADLHVFQMGKVGSHTIARGLQQAGYAGRVIHLHWVTDLVEGYPSNRLPYSRILVHERERPVKVISGVREIVSWAISGHFQYLGDALLNVRDAMAMVEDHFWASCQDGLRWFDHRYFCDLDVYASPFDHAAGASRIRHAGLDLLIYRREQLSKLGPTFADFLELPGFDIGAANVGSGKAYAMLYREVARRFRLPGNLLSTLYDSPFMRHFYSDDERQQAYERWVRKDSRPTPDGLRAVNDAIGMRLAG